jgi:Lar family restriction alleviation protein
MSEYKLLPCPFCGGGDIALCTTGSSESAEYSFACFDCGATGPEKAKISSANSAWNRRVSATAEAIDP